MSEGNLYDPTFCEAPSKALCSSHLKQKVNSLSDLSVSSLSNVARYSWASSVRLQGASIVLFLFLFQLK